MLPSILGIAELLVGQKACAPVLIAAGSDEYARIGGADEVWQDTCGRSCRYVGDDHESRDGTILQL